MDLYRLDTQSNKTNNDRIRPLNLPHVLTHAMALVEWPSRIHPYEWPNDRLAVTVTLQDNDDDDSETTTRRRVVLQPHSTTWQQRLDQLQPYIEDWIVAS